MTYEEFKKEVMTSFIERVTKEHISDDISASFETIDETTRTVEKLMVRSTKSNLALAFRVTDTYDDFCNDPNVTIDSLVDDLIHTVVENKRRYQEQMDYLNGFILHYDKVKEHLYLRMIPGNSPRLNCIPHKDISDMAVIVCIHCDGFDKINENEGKSVVTVEKQLMDEYGVTEEQLFEDALQNTLSKEKLTIEPIKSRMMKMMGYSEEEIKNSEDPCDYDICIFSNTSGFQGAAVMFYPDFWDEAVKIMNGSFFIIPSSQHEIIVISAKSVDGDISSINDTIRMVNSTMLNPRETLSDHFYFYDADNKIIQTADEYINSQTQTP